MRLPSFAGPIGRLLIGALTYVSAQPADERFRALHMRSTVSQTDSRRRMTSDYG